MKRMRQRLCDVTEDVTEDVIGDVIGDRTDE
jgi:hypothetical protein